MAGVGGRAQEVGLVSEATVPMKMREQEQWDTSQVADLSSGVMDSLGYPSRVENGERGGEEISRCVWEFQVVMSFKGRRVRRPWQSSG